MVALAQDLAKATRQEKTVKGGTTEIGQWVDHLPCMQKPWVWFPLYGLPNSARNDLWVSLEHCWIWPKIKLKKNKSLQRNLIWKITITICWWYDNICWKSQYLLFRNYKSEQWDAKNALALQRVCRFDHTYFTCECVSLILNTIPHNLVCSLIRQPSMYSSAYHNQSE